MLSIAPQRWMRDAVPAGRYRLVGLRCDGEVLHLDLSTSFRGARCTLQVALTPERVSYRCPPALPEAVRAAILRDLQQRCLPHRGAIQQTVDAAREELACRAVDPAWTALQRLSAGHPEPGPAAEPSPGLPVPTHRAALGALQRLLAGDRAGFEDFYLPLAADPAIDRRVMAAICLAAGDTETAAALRPLSGISDKAGMWRWLQGAPAEEGAAVSLPLPARVQVAARAVWRWGGAAERPEQPIYGSPLARAQQKPRIPLTPRTQELVTRFSTDGFVALRGALSPERAAAWSRRMAGHFRHTLAAEPRHGDGLVHPGRLDPDVPEAGFGGLLRWRTGASIPLHLFSAELAAVVDALAGLEHLQANVSDQLLITRDLQLRPQPPEPCWHLDEPHAGGHLDQQRLAVLALVLVTDVTEADGPTMFLPESPPLVAAALAEHPGQDQDDRAWTAAIGARCARWQRAIGSAGDVFLLHPLTLHARQRPTRTSLRIIANVNLHARQPLSYTEPRSPIERYARP